jgi:DNA polymerase-3 subunit delta
MRLYPEKLQAHLQQQLLPVYLISGDETLLVQECADAVRAAARSAGCSEREVIEAGGRDFDWQVILQSAGNLSLFAERRLLELRLPSGKPGTEGSKALLEYLEVASPDDVLLIIAGKIDKQSTNSKWYKALDKAGATVQLWPVDARELPRWLQQRVSAAGMQIDRDAVQLLAERVEGNLLAAVQEVEKLKLLATDGHITAETVTEGVLDSARYNLFDMVDTALAGNARDSLRKLQGLRGEGTEPPVILWALAREVRTLFDARQDCERGSNPQQALSARRVWKNRMGLMQAALGRHDDRSAGDLMQQLLDTDASIKGFGPGNPWQQLENLVLTIATAQPVTAADHTG